MKKLLAGAFAFIMIVTACVTGVLAYDRSCNYMDADGNGICDNHIISHCPRSNFADADNNGICDNRTAEACPRMQHHGGGHHGYGHGCSR